MGAIQSIYTYRYDRGELLKFRMWKKCDLIDFDVVQLLVPGVPVWVISETADLLVFSPRKTLRNLQRRIETKRCRGKNALLMSEEVRGESPDFFELIGRK